MYGSKSKSVNVHQVKLDRARLYDGKSLFMPVIPRGGTIKDIILYRPYTPGVELNIEFLNDKSEGVGTYSGLLTNKLHAINLRVEGIVSCLISSPNIKELIVFYEI